MTSMKRYSKWIVPLSIGLGLWLGFHILELKKNRSQDTIRVLSFNGTLPRPWLDQIEKQLKIQIINTEVTNKSKWEAAFKMQAHDVLAIFNFQVEQLVGQKRLKNIQVTLEKQKRKLSADFKNLPFDPVPTYALPFSWGVMREWSTSSDKLSEKSKSDQELADVQLVFRAKNLEWLNSKVESATTIKINHSVFLEKSEDDEIGLQKPDSGASELWVMALAVDQRSEMSDNQLNEFFDVIGSTANLKKHIELVGQATPFAVIENSSIPGPLRPSHLRTVSLRDLNWLRVSFQDNFEIEW